jgi:hypothetical protein
LENLAVKLVHFIEISEVYVADGKHLSEKKDYWQNELKSLGIEPRRQNELNDKEEEKLQALAESIKAVYYQDYKTAYNSSRQGNDDKEEELLDKSHFDHII